MKFSIKGFFSKCDQIGRKKSLMAKFIFCAANNSEHRENDSNKMYLISAHQDDTILVPQTQKWDRENSANENTVQLSNETSKLDERSQAFPETIYLQSNYEEERRIRDVFKEQSFKDFQPSFENKLMKMEETIILNCRYHSHTQKFGDEGHAATRSVTDLSKKQNHSFKKRIFWKSVMIEYLTKQLVISTETNFMS